MAFTLQSIGVKSKVAEMSGYRIDWNKNRAEVPEGWIYLGNDTERFVLGQPGKRNILVLLSNPGSSTPGESHIDPTIKKIRSTTKEDGYDGWFVVCIYPKRTANPKELPQKEDKKLCKRNLAVIKSLTEHFYIDKILAAWGNTIDERFYLGDVLYDIEEELVGDYQWYYRGEKTKIGHPMHPRYMKSGEPYNWFAIADYAANWRYANVW